jgi:GWxTD domain-containing protein
MELAYLTNRYNNKNMLSRKYRQFLLAIIAIILIRPESSLPTDLTSVILDKKAEYLFVDYGVFASDEIGKVRVEVYYQFYNRALTFKPDGDLFKAEYEIEITIMDKRGRKLDGETQEKSVTVASEIQARSASDYRVSQVNFDLEPNKYEIKFNLKDKAGDKNFSDEFGVDAGLSKDDYPKVSKILFAQAVGPADGSSDQFTKGNMMVVPSVSRIYGTEENSKLVYYIEIYNGKDEKSDHVTVQTLIRPRKGDMVYRDTLTETLDAPVKRQLREISLAEFAPGEYEIEIKLQGRRGKKLDEEKAKFEIEWTEESLLEHNWKLIVKQISLIAEQKELKALENCESLEERKAGLKEYWDSKDPYPETPRNELKMEFYKRISIANENFGFLSRPGWDTDRGRVLVRYGVPNEIEDFPFSMGTYPYQEWHYYNALRYRTFTFVDDNHDGDYRLVYPYDGLWQKPEF